MATKLHPIISFRPVGYLAENVWDSSVFFVAAAAAGISGIPADKIMSLPTPKKGSAKTGTKAPIADPAIDAKYTRPAFSGAVV